MTDTPAPRVLLAPNPGRRLSEVLRDLQEGEGARVSVGDLVAGLRDRSFAPLMVIFAAPNVFLFIPGSSAFTGVPLMVLAIQLLLGRSDVWLPRLIADRAIERASFARLVRAALPTVERIERLARPRWWPGSYQLAERIIGLCTFVLAGLLSLPIPFANAGPALAIVMLALGLSERDGYWLVAGLAASAAAIALAAGMAIASIAAFVALVLS